MVVQGKGFRGHRVSFEEWNVLKVIMVMVAYILSICYKKSIKLYTLNVWITQYVNYILI